MRGRSSAALAGAAASVAVVLGAQQREPPRFSTEASAVVLDVVVRDARGRPVVGLTRDDFQVFENRRRQTITVFEGPAAPAPPAAAAPAAEPAAPTAPPAFAAPPRVVALVLEQLGPAARPLAAQAAHRLLGALDPHDFAGVFTLDRSVHVVHDYAPPSDAVRRAVDRAALQPGLPLRRAGIVPGVEFASPERGQPTQETRDESKRVRGMATLDALTQVIRGLALLPGRKMVVLFSEGLALDASEETAQIARADGPRTMGDTWLTDGRYERFQRLIEEANAAQVAFYTFDAAGLRVESQFANLGFGGAPYVGLMALAEGTGGAFVENTNDLAPGAVRAAEDHASYYVLGYTPTQPPDAEYRSLEVRVRCDGCRVLSRRGYRATPSREVRQLGVRDVAPFLVLDGGVEAADLPVALDVEAPARVTATVPESAVSRGGVVTFLARVLDQKGKPTAVLSQHVELRGEADPNAVLRFSRSLVLPTKSGTIELVVYDHASTRATVVRRRLPQLPSQ